MWSGPRPLGWTTTIRLHWEADSLPQRQRCAGRLQPSVIFERVRRSSKKNRVFGKKNCKKTASSMIKYLPVR
jgi:hypothetical protein